MGSQTNAESPVMGGDQLAAAKALLRSASSLVTDVRASLLDTMRAGPHSDEQIANGEKWLERFDDMIEKIESMLEAS